MDLTTTALQDLENALEAIANPIKHLREEAEKCGAHLNGIGAAALADNASWLRELAKKALQSYNDKKEYCNSTQSELLKSDEVLLQKAKELIARKFGYAGADEFFTVDRRPFQLIWDEVTEAYARMYHQKYLHYLPDYLEKVYGSPAEYAEQLIQKYIQVSCEKISYELAHSFAIMHVKEIITECANFKQLFTSMANYEKESRQLYWENVLRELQKEK